LFPDPDGNLPAEDSIFQDNLRLSRAEYLRQHLYLRSQPRYLSLVLGNACNIHCPHCYQSKNGDSLLKPPGIGRELRREFTALYPFLSTLRIQGGEVFAFVEFRDLIEDVAATVGRPILSVSTNGTLIDEEWAERIVRTPFRNLTVSIDAGTAPTYARLRPGADLQQVLTNVRRIQRWKDRLGSELPYLDSFFVIMRSNFREIPQHLELMKQHGFSDVSLQTILVNEENASREPALARDEVITEGAEVRELYGLLREVLPAERRRFRMIRTSGLTSLFERHGLDTSFLLEEFQGLYPDSDDLSEVREAAAPDLHPAGARAAAGAGSVRQPTPPGVRNRPLSPAAQDASYESCPAECGRGGDGVRASRADDDRASRLCPNPWTTLFVAENGDVRLCFLSEKIGNLYETPLASIWNCQRALAKRSDLLSGRYLASGCSPLWCAWREGRKAAPAASGEAAALRAEMKELVARAWQMRLSLPTGSASPAIAAVRRLLDSRDQRIAELEAMFVQLCEANAAVHEKGQEHIDHLENKIQQLNVEIDRLSQRLLIRLAQKVWREWASLWRPPRSGK